MAWELYIKTFDVGRGESSVIVANEPITGQHRTMLIDGGLANQGAEVNTYLNNFIGVGAAVDHILVTHYDVDHSGGIMAILGADNFYAICDKVAEITAPLTIGADRPQMIASAAAAACMAFFGAYDLPGGPNYAAQAAIIATAARLKVGVGSGLSDAAAAVEGVDEAEDGLRIYGPFNDVLIPSRSTAKRRAVCRLAAIAAVNAAGVNVRAATRTAVFNELQTLLNDSFKFNTNGRFANSQVIDTGAGAGEPDIYPNLVAGLVMMGNTSIQAPAINRTRNTPNLGAEILWNSGPNAMLAPANSPMVYVMARNSYVWRAPNNRVPLAQALDNNNDSYGLILRFNNFVFYTGGDLISAGEDLIADAVMANGLPNPNGGTFPVPHCIAAFKVGHHGADTCTSQHFLNTGLQRVGIISCGAMYGHPFQSVIDELQACATIDFFYLTACAYIRNYIPASSNPAGNQLTTVGNKSRVAGGIAIPPGHITLYLNQAESSSTSVAIPLNMGDTALRQFHVNYYDYDLAPAAGFRTENTIF
jgi:beta-lactamase superfamily II metal-dependent hydrolase